MRPQVFSTVASLVLLPVCLSSVFAESSGDDALRGRMEAAMEALDSSKTLATVPWDEYVVLLYGKLQGRTPTLHEFAVLRGLRDSIALRPSEALSLVLRGEEDCPTHEQIRAFLESEEAGRFISTAQSRAVAHDLAAACDACDWAGAEAVGMSAGKGRAVVPDPPNVPYTVYFGYLHAHSRLSDGEGEPIEAYTQARASGMDFFALTDHAELLMLWPWEDKYAQLCNAADVSDDPGHFAALFGFEWSNPLLGHINVINSTQFTHTLRHITLSTFYGWLEGRPEAFGTFNHPGWLDPIKAEFLHGRLFPKAVTQMVGIELWNEDDGFDTYHYGGSWESDFTYMDAMNRQGWRLGALGGEDNHSGHWGQGSFRTGVLAEELTREAIADAFRHRRFYSTEDKDLVLDFRCTGYPMGSVLSGVPREFTVSASDGSGDTFAEARLYRDGELIETKAVAGNPVNAVFTDAAGSGDAYYYVIVRQNDDNDLNGRNDEAISSPIWFGAPQPVDPGPSGCAGVGGSGASASVTPRFDAFLFVLAPLMLYLFAWGLKRRTV